MDYDECKSYYSWQSNGRRTYPCGEGEYITSLNKYNTTPYNNNNVYNTGLSLRGTTLYCEKDYGVDSMSRYSSSSSNYDRGYSSSRSPYTSSYTSGSYTSRYGNNRYGTSSYDLTSSRYNTTNISVPSRYDSLYSSSRTSIPKPEESSSRRGSRSSFSSDISTESREDTGDLTTRRRSGVLSSRRTSYTDDVDTNIRSYSRKSDRLTDTDYITDRYSSSRRESLKDSDKTDVSRTDVKRYSSDTKSSLSKQSSLEKQNDRHGDYSSSYSYRRSNRKYDDIDKPKVEISKNGSESPSTVRTSYRTRRELERTGTESNDSDISSKKKHVDDIQPYESFADRRRRRRESLESNNSNTDNEISHDRTRWRSLVSDQIKEVSTPTEGDTDKNNEHTNVLESKEVQLPIKEQKTTLPSADHQDVDLKAERIAKYKEQRRKQLQSMGTKIDVSSDSDSKKSIDVNKYKINLDLKGSENIESNLVSKVDLESKEIILPKDKQNDGLKNIDVDHIRATQRSLPSPPDTNISSTTVHEEHSSHRGKGLKTKVSSDSRDLIDKEKLKGKDKDLIALAHPTVSSPSSSLSKKLISEKDKQSLTVGVDMVNKTEKTPSSRLIEITSKDKTSEAITSPSENKISPPVSDKVSLPSKIKTVSSQIKSPPPLKETSPSPLKAKTLPSKASSPPPKTKSPPPKTSTIPIVKRERATPPRSLPAAQDKQKIVEDRKTRTKPSTGEITGDKSNTGIDKKTTQQLVKVSTTKSAATANVKVETKKATIVPPIVKKPEDGHKVSRKTVSERFAKTQIPGRKPSSGNYTSDDEEGKQERPPPPRSPAARRARIGSSKSPSNRRKLPDIDRLSTPKTKVTKETIRTEQKDGRAPSPKKNLAVPESPANLDNLMIDNKDYLSDDSTINTPSPLINNNEKKTQHLEAPVVNLFKNGLSKDEQLETEITKGDDSSNLTLTKTQITNIKVDYDSDDDEFNTAPSTPQVSRASVNNGQVTTDNNETKKYDEIQTTTSNRSTTSLKLLPSLSPSLSSPSSSSLSNSSNRGPIKPSHNIITAWKPKQTFVKTEKKDEPPIKRGNDFSKLLQKFSSSELSSTESEASNRYHRSHPGQSISLSSSDESYSERRTPERSHSFKLHTVKEESPKVPKRSSSFKSEFMRKKQQTNTPASPEVTSALQTRSDITENKSKNTSDILDSDKSKMIGPSSDIHQDSNSLAQSKSKLYKIDTSLAELTKVTEELDKPESTISHGYISEPELGPITQERRASSTASLSDAVQYIKDVETSISARITESISKHSRENSPFVKDEDSRTIDIIINEPTPTRNNTIEIENVTIDESYTDDILTSANTTTDAKLYDNTSIICSNNNNIVSTNISDITHIGNSTTTKDTSPSSCLTTPEVNNKQNEIIMESQDNAKNDTIANDRKSTDLISIPIERVAVTSENTTLSTSKDKPTKESSEYGRDETVNKQTTTSTLRRSESLKTTSIQRSESLEKRKGILKRTPSLPKQSSVPIVDQQLAKILQMRKQAVEEDNDKSDVDDNKPRRLSVSDEIMETLKREKETRKEKTDDDDHDEEDTSLSVSERIFKMQTKIEEEKFAATPKSRSGIATPKSPFRIRSGAVTPKMQMSFDESHNINEDILSSEKLIERLTTLAEDGQVESVSERMKKLQESQGRHEKIQKQKRDTWRRRTQPVTIEEISAADSLDSVNTFRSLVRKKATASVFEHLEQKPKLPVNKKSEFPEHLKPKKRRSREERYQTLPVTAAELMCIPENEMMESDTLKSKAMARERQDSKADSGILSGSDVENLSTASDSLRSLSLDMDIGDDDVCRLSVSAKTSMFKHLDEKASKDRYKGSASGAKRYIDRKKRERYLTQPITEEEVKSAAELNEENKPKVVTTEIVNRNTQETSTDRQEDDELVKLSLKEKLKLFAKKKEEENKTLPKQTSPAPKRRSRKQASRFSTQPVTFEEVEKAAKISPLHMSLVKPPDPEVLKGLPLKAQRDLVASHAEACLSQSNSRNNSKPNSRAGSQPGSRRTSFTEDDINDTTTSSVTHAKSEGDFQKSPGILRKTEIRQSSPDLDVRSILKSEKEKIDCEPRGILKRAETIETSKPSDETRSILKNRDTSLSPKLESTKHTRESDPEPKSILKTDIEEVISKPTESKPNIIEKNEHRGILKKESSFEGKRYEPVKSILKKESEDEDNVEDNNNSITISDTSTKRRSRHNDRYLTQPAEVTPDKSPQSQRKYKYEGRHKTQPITPDEKKEAELISTPQIMKGGSVADRLNALKRSGEEEWKKRVPKSLDFDSPQDVKLREKNGLSDARPVSLADRLSLLDVNKTTWKERVEDSDVSKFTVAGKISKTIGNVESPLVKRIKHKRDALNLDLGSKENSPVDSPVTTPTHERIPLPKDIIKHASSSSSVQEITSSSSSSSLSTSKTTIIKEEISTSTVTIPDITSSDFDSFFIKDDNIQVDNSIDVDVDVFNDLFIDSQDILSNVKKPRPPRKSQAKVVNPLKTIAVEVKTEYTEITTGLAEKESKRIKTEKISKDAGFAQEALAGLASKENFSKVALRKTDITSTPGNKDRLDPFKDIMLIHIKGRRNVQARLVEPTSLSINSGDCYVLVTSDKIINWIGNYSNVIEKAKSADVTSFIHQKKDLGCKSSTTMNSIDEEKQRLGAGKHFWSTLGGQKDYQACGPEEEDEIYEVLINKTNMVYRLKDNSLMPYEEYWGTTLKYEMLDPEMVLVFDFGSEFYLWLGKKVSPEERKIGRILSQQLWDKGYDYTSCDINPLSPLHTEESSSVPLKGVTRPDWTLFGKVHQGMETILFKEKFFDWPDSARIIKVKGQDKMEKTENIELKAYDVSKMVPLNTAPVTLLLEGTNVGRGDKWLEDMQGFIRQTDIITLNVDVWHVMEYDHYKLPSTSYGQFHDGDTYVVRWQYMVSNAGLKSLKGSVSRQSKTGRERCAYFFWQGKNSTINEKGASALMTVELDEERGPQVRVLQGTEPPCFLNLFKGSMIIHIGKREEEESNTQGPWRFYSVRNELENELCLVEIDLCIDNLRSLSSFLLLNVKTGHLYIWHGCKSPSHTRTIAKLAADKLQTNCALEVGLHKDANILIMEMEEGEEKAQIWGALESKDRSRYMSLINSSKTYEHTVRLFYMTSVSGIFEVTEILNPTRSSDLYTPFPFLQSDLYKVSQPALFLIDNNEDVYLWQGWWPEGISQDDNNVHTGSAHSRFNIDRKCALETTINYCKASRSQMPNMYTVCAGLEPQQFTNIFPYWIIDEKARELNLKDGKKDGYLESAEELLNKLNKSRYTYAELQERPLPEGVDASKLESYLDDEEFQSLLNMTKEEFYALPSWKQIQLKQPTGLF